MIKSYWNKPALFLHIAMASAVTCQLFLSLAMNAPSGLNKLQIHSFEHLAFTLHVWCGMFTVCIVALHWIWSCFDQKSIARLSHLFPYTVKGFYEIKKDIQLLFKFQLPQAGERQGLPGLIHGFGFLAVSAMAITGSYIFYFIITHQTLKPFHGISVLALHSFIATFVWIYWYAHIAMAGMHWYLNKQKIG